MKISYNQVFLCAVAILSAAFAVPAHAATIANWKVLQTSATGPATTSGLNTDSPVFGDGTDLDMDGVGVAGRFGSVASPASVTLAIGETLTVSTTITLTGGITGAANHYRFAVQNDGGQFAANSVNTWSGGWTYAVKGSIYQANTNGNFLSTNTNASSLSSTTTTSGTLNGNTATPYTWTMTITRDSATTVDLFTSLIGGGGYSETMTSNNVTTSLFTYTAMGILTTGNTDLDQLTVSNAQFSVIPEPSAALLGGLGLLALLRRRRN
jgi:hypothetical protein